MAYKFQSGDATLSGSVTLVDYQDLLFESDGRSDVGTAGEQAGTLFAQNVSASYGFFGDGTGITGISADKIDVSDGSALGELLPLLMGASGSVGGTAGDIYGDADPSNTDFLWFRPSDGNMNLPGQLDAKQGVTGSSVAVGAGTFSSANFTQNGGEAINVSYGATFADVSGQQVRIHAGGNVGIAASLIVSGAISANSLTASQEVQASNIQLNNASINTVGDLTLPGVSIDAAGNGGGFLKLDAGSGAFNVWGSGLTGINAELQVSQSISTPQSVSASVNVSAGSANFSSAQFSQYGGNAINVSYGATFADVSGQQVRIHGGGNVGIAASLIVSGAISANSLSGTQEISALNLNTNNASIAADGALTLPGVSIDAAGNGGGFLKLDAGSGAFNVWASGDVGLDNDMIVSGTLSASILQGDGSALTGLSSDTVDTTETPADTTYYVPFVDDSTSQAGETLRVYSGLNYNPNSAKVEVGPERKVDTAVLLSLTSSLTGGVADGTFATFGGKRRASIEMPSAYIQSGNGIRIDSGYYNQGAGNRPFMQIIADAGYGDGIIALSGSHADSGVMIESSIEMNEQIGLKANATFSEMLSGSADDSPDFQTHTGIKAAMGRFDVAASGEVQVKAEISGSGLLNIGGVIRAAKNKFIVDGDANVRFQGNLETPGLQSAGNLPASITSGSILLDSNDAGNIKTLTLVDYATALAGAGLTATNGVLSSDASPTPNDIGDADSTLQEGMNFSSVVFTAAHTWTLPSAPDDGDVVSVKAPSNATTWNLQIERDGGTGHTIDGETFVVLESDYGAVDLVYVGSNVWVLK
tara:strand:+ start:2942 stop:5389 length:2448 start_codon:yes stop_codon:yes gene_type:complete